jgi:hypothetical protein
MTWLRRNSSKYSISAFLYHQVCVAEGAHRDSYKKRGLMKQERDTQFMHRQQVENSYRYKTYIHIEAIGKALCWND